MESGLESQYGVTGLKFGIWNQLYLGLHLSLFKLNCKIKIIVLIPKKCGDEDQVR